MELWEKKQIVRRMKGVQRKHLFGDKVATCDDDIREEKYRQLFESPRSGSEKDITP